MVVGTDRRVEAVAAARVEGQPGRGGTGGQRIGQHGTVVDIGGDDLAVDGGTAFDRGAGLGRRHRGIVGAGDRDHDVLRRGVTDLDGVGDHDRLAGGEEIEVDRRRVVCVSDGLGATAVGDRCAEAQGRCERGGEAGRQHHAGTAAHDRGAHLRCLQHLAGIDIDEAQRARQHDVLRLRVSRFAHALLGHAGQDRLVEVDRLVGPVGLQHRHRQLLHHLHRQRRAVGEVEGEVARRSVGHLTLGVGLDRLQEGDVALQFGPHRRVEPLGAAQFEQNGVDSRAAGIDVPRAVDVLGQVVDEGVSARVAVDDVVARTAVNDVVARAAGDPVVARSAVDGVGTAAAVQVVVAVGADDVAHSMLPLLVRDFLRRAQCREKTSPQVRAPPPRAGDEHTLL